MQVVGETEGDDACARGHCCHEFLRIPLDGELGGDGTTVGILCSQDFQARQSCDVVEVEQEDVGGSSGRRRLQIGVGVGREFGERLGGLGAELGEGLDRLRLAVFLYGEVVAGEAVDGVALGVRHSHIHDGLAGVDLERGCGDGLLLEPGRGARSSAWTAAGCGVASRNIVAARAAAGTTALRERIPASWWLRDAWENQTYYRPCAAGNAGLVCLRIFPSLKTYNP